MCGEGRRVSLCVERGGECGCVGGESVCGEGSVDVCGEESGCVGRGE